MGIVVLQAPLCPFVRSVNSSDPPPPFIRHLRYGLLGFRNALDVGAWLSGRVGEIIVIQELGLEELKSLRPIFPDPSPCNTCKITAFSSPDFAINVPYSRRSRIRQRQSTLGVLNISSNAQMKLITG